MIMRTTCKILALSSTALLMLPTPANAQGGAAMSQPAATEADSGIGFGEIIVTAQRRAENVLSVPLSITATVTFGVLVGSCIHAEGAPMAGKAHCSV